MFSFESIARPVKVIFKKEEKEKRKGGQEEVTVSNGGIALGPDKGEGHLWSD